MTPYEKLSIALAKDDNIFKRKITENLRIPLRPKELMYDDPANLYFEFSKTLDENRNTLNNILSQKGGSVNIVGEVN